MTAPQHPLPTRRLIALLLVALGLRLLWGFGIIQLRGGDFIFTAMPDAQGYALLADSFLGRPVPPDQVYKLPHLSLWRTPGQPLLLALCRLAGDQAAAVLVLLNSLLGVAFVGLAFAVGRALFRDRPAAAWLAAGAAALSPTGITLVATGLTEVPFQTALWAAIYLLVSGEEREDNGRVLWSGVALIVAAAIRPSAQFLPFLWAPAAWLLGRLLERRVLWKPALVAALLPLLLIGAWTARNGLVHGVYTYAGVAPYDLDRYVGIEVFRAVHPEYDRDRAEKIYGIDSYGPEKRELWEGREPAEVYRFHQERVRKLFHQHPARFVAVFVGIAAQNVLEPAKLMEQQLPEGKAVWKIWRRLHRGGLIVLLGLDLAALILLCRSGRWSIAVLLTGYILYFIALSGVLYLQGSRLSYPVAPALWYLAAQLPWRRGPARA